MNPYIILTLTSIAEKEEPKINVGAFEVRGKL